MAQQEGWLILLDATGEPVGEEEDLVLAMPIDAAAEARVTAEEAAEEEAEADSAMPVPPANVTEVPSVATLMAPSPNPFSRNTTLHFSLSQAGFTTLTVYDVLGREVAVLVDGAREAGWHAVSLDGSRLAAGTYVVRLVARDVAFTRRVTVVR